MAQLSTKNYFVNKIVLSQLLRDWKEKLSRKLKKSDKPWMYHKELDIFVEVIQNLQPAKCLEWGSGFSTLYFPKLLQPSANWLSIEHDQAWVEKIKMLNNKKNVTIKHIKPHNEKWKGDGTYEDFKQYVDYPSNLKFFDLIIVDGRARKDCLERGVQLLSDKGVIILHDANRLKYHNAFKFYKNSTLFTDHHTSYGGLWIGSNHVAIDEVLDVKKNQKVWERHAKLAKYFFAKK